MYLETEVIYRGNLVNRKAFGWILILYEKGMGKQDLGQEDSVKTLGEDRHV